ncbi:MAG: YheC/YheD family protein [Desulfitobacteriaceae bacterium]
MNPLVLSIPTIAITGSSGKTTTREFISSILETQWKVLKTTGNKNLPLHTKKTIESFDPSFQAIVLELGMGKQGAGQRHCRYFQPNIAIITNIGTAHLGNLGNSIRSTATFKSALIKYLNPNGKLLLNNDDKNSKLLETETFNGEIITVGIENKADYQASYINNLANGMSFKVLLDNKSEQFFIPTFGKHNIYNALFAIAICHRLNFTSSEIRSGLKNYQIPIKRLNLIKLRNHSLLIDDTVNANPQSVKAAIDVLVEIGKDKKKIVVLGSMLELGKYTIKGHKEIGHYLTEKKIDAIYTYGKEAKWILKGALDRGYPADKVQHFEERELLHKNLNNCIALNSVILVKGSSLTKMSETVKYIQDRFMFSISLDDTIDQNFIYLNDRTFKQMNIETDSITLHFGALTKELTIQTDSKLEPDKIKLPSKLTDQISIPDLPYDYYIKGNHLFLGPVIGFLILPRYYNDPMQQFLRFSTYDQIKGLIFLFKQNTFDKTNKTITGYYYDPETKGFIPGTFPYPSAIFNRLPINSRIYKHFKENIGQNLFNYPYTNTNKWTFWYKMCKQPQVKKHLPKTKKYLDVKSLVQMLNIYSAVYLKPVSLAGGNGILHVKKSSKGYLLSDNEGKQIVIKSESALAITLKNKLVENKKYIVQQEIPFNSSENKIDFRVYFQKDITKNWKYSGMETKIAKKGSIISNSKNRERIMPGATALKEIYHLNEKKTEQKIKEISQLCIKALKLMENNRNHFGDAAVDLVIDKSNKVWLLEVQLNYAAEIKAKRTEDEQLILPNILPTPFEYAKALAGF